MAPGENSRQRLERCEISPHKPKNISRLSRIIGLTNLPYMTSLAASGRHLSKFEKRQKMPNLTGLFALSLTQCQRSLTARSTPQWRSGRSTTTLIVLYLRSIIWGFGESCVIVLCITSQSAKGPKICSIDILVDIQPVG